MTVSATPFASAIYTGEVVHRRFKPTEHRLRYGVFSLLLDLDELPALGAALRFFSVNRFNLFCFRETDHGDGGGRLRDWVDGQLARAGIDISGGAVRLLCYPRILGYVFNPLSVYYCHGADGRLLAVLYEVSNTFGERHTYLIPVHQDGSDLVVQTCEKRFYVSPFIAVAGEYRFKLAVPDDSLSLTIDQSDDRGCVLTACFSGRREALTDRTLMRVFARFPLMTVKVIAGIHWEALRLWRKKIPMVERPPAPDEPVTLVKPANIPSIVK